MQVLYQLSYSPIGPAVNYDITISRLIRTSVFTLDDLACVPPRTPSAPEEQVNGGTRGNLSAIPESVKRGDSWNVCVLLACPDLPYQGLVNRDPVFTLQLMRNHSLRKVNCPDPANQVI